MSAAIVDREYFDIFMVPPPVELLVFDAKVREVDLLVEVGKVVVARPLLNLTGVAIRAAVAVPIAFVQPLLILALELVVEGDSSNPRTALGELLSLSQIGVEDLGIVLDFPRLD